MKRSATMLLLFLFLFPVTLLAQWQSAGGPDGGTVNGLYNYSGYVYSGTTGGIFRSSDGGDSWEFVYGGQSPTGVYTFTVHEGRFFAGTGKSQILVSTDGGTTWSPAASGTGSHVVNLVSRASGLYAGSIWGGVTRTTDYGQTWEERNNGLPLPRLAALFASGPALFAGIDGGGLYRSTDEGMTWTDISSAVPAGEVRGAVQHQGALFTCFAGSGVFKSTDDGVTWDSTAATGSMLDFYSDGARLYAVDFNTLWFTDDGGVTWTSRPLMGAPTAWGSAVLKIPGRILVGHVSSGLSMSQDDGQTWSASSSGHRATRVISTLKKGSTLLAGANDYGLHRSTDNGMTWTRTHFPTYNGEGKVLVERNGVIFCGTGIGFHYSTDDGSSWQLVSGAGYSIECIFNGPSVMYAGTNRGKVLASTDDGMSWTERGDLGTNDDINTLIDNGTVLMASTQGDGIFVSTDGGVTWEERNNGLGASPSSQSLAYVDGIWYAGRTPGLYVSSDNGQNWQVKVNAVRSSNSYRLTAVPGAVVIGTYDGGVFYYDTKDSVWSEIGSGYAASTVLDLALMDGTVLLGSGADGMWMRALADLTPSPVLQTTPLSVDFGEKPTGTGSKENVTLENTGDGTMRVRSVSIAGADASAFHADFSDDGVLYAGESASVEVTFTPSEKRAYTAELVITSNDVNAAERRIPLTGSGREVPVARVDPTSHDFGDVTTGTQAERTFTIFNDGNLDLEVQMPTIEGPDASAFSQSGTQMTIPPSQVGNFAVQFIPMSEGQKQARVVLVTNDPNRARIEIPLTGNGVRPNEADIEVNPPSISFAATDVGSSRSEKLRIENRGGADLVISATPLSGNGKDAFIVRDGGSMTIVPNAFVDVTIEFHPEANQPYSATLYIESNDPDIPSFPVLLYGLGKGDISPIIELEKLSLSFGTVPVGVSRSEDVRIRNVGRGALNVTGFRFQGSGADQFSLKSGSPGTLEPNEDMTVTVEYTPDVTGLHRADFIISSNDPVTPNALLTLTGNAIVNSVGDVAVTPTVALLPVHPNPVAGTARIPFVLRRAAHVRLELFDILGARIRVLRDAAYAPGTHTVTFSAASLPEGVYLYRLTTAAGVMTRTLLVHRR